MFVIRCLLSTTLSKLGVVQAVTAGPFQRGRVWPGSMLAVLTRCWLPGWSEIPPVCSPQGLQTGRPGEEGSLP